MSLSNLKIPMKLSTYGNALLILRVSNSLDAIQDLIDTNDGDLKAASDELMDLHKLQKLRLESFHLQNHPKSFFHIMDEQLKLIFRSKERRYTFIHSDINKELSLFPLINFDRKHATLPEGVFRADYIRGPLSTIKDVKLENIRGYSWENNPFKLDLVQFNPINSIIRTDNQVIYREFIINDNSSVLQL